MKQVLVIEDDKDIRELLKYNLSRETFDVVLCSDGETGLEQALSGSFDLIILDLMLPHTNGIQICQRLRQNPATSATPIIMLTAKSEESDIIFGLGIGADDYMTKPFSIKELIARMYARLRTQPLGEAAKASGPASRVKKGQLELDRSSFQLKLGGAPIGLTLAEFRILEALMLQAGLVLSREQLLEAVGAGEGLIDRNIDVHVRSIRKKLGEARDVIETVRGLGYRFKKEP